MYQQHFLVLLYGYNVSTLQLLNFHQHTYYLKYSAIFHPDFFYSYVYLPISVLQFFSHHLQFACKLNIRPPLQVFLLHQGLLHIIPDFLHPALPQNPHQTLIPHITRLVLSHFLCLHPPPGFHLSAPLHTS